MSLYDDLENLSSYAELEAENKKLELKKEAIIIGGIMGMTCADAAFSAFGFHSCINQAARSNCISWDQVKTSSIVITNDDNLINYHFMGNNGDKKNYDLINNYEINTDTIIYSINSTSYLVNSDNVKNYYTKEELKEILKEFSMNQNYTASDETVKVLVKEK